MTPAGNSIDLRRFDQVFFEECAEHLAQVEEILVGLRDREPDQEELNAIFRAAHSIKGGAGIFGFDDMTVVTHVMESLLDRLRNREIPFFPSLTDLLLEAGDVISMQVASHRAGTAASPEAAELVRKRLQQAIEQDGFTFAEETLPSYLPAALPAESPLSRYRIIFTPPPDIFSRGIRVDCLIRELAELAESGEFECRAELVELPELERFQAESCITRWHFTLVSSASRDDFYDVFMFAADPDQLAIERLGDAALPVHKAPISIAAAPQDAPDISATGELHSPAPEATTPAASAAATAQTVSAAPAPRSGESEGSIRVNLAKVDQLVNQVGELLITQAMLTQFSACLDPVLHEPLQRCVALLEKNTRDLQGSVMSIRLVPIGIVFNRFPRMVREIAAKLGKSVQFKSSGDSTELDKGLIEKVADPLSHLVRNALDHGLETAEKRLASGKPASGTLELAASQQGGRVVIEVIDDGAGLDRDRIMAKAVERGISCSDDMRDEEVWQLIFMPGFSTAESVTDLSGRGVGMDVVLKNVQALGGRVQIASRAGRGTRVSISLPLTLAIVEGLSVAVGAERFIVPLNVIVESLQPKPEQLKSLNGREMVQVRGEYLPILRLHRLLEVEGAQPLPQRGILVLVEVEEERVALLADVLLDEQQVVVKSLEANFRKVEGSAGATILGDGRVALILEAAELLVMHKRGN
ncbi:chemotaxis protein CheW [Geomonas sp.]|uniref:chemotaxis protein CheW n=1 Tax=Geomonas sp. TaxID=2651584 RepID=UPI002B48251A|nr:chemotaxis protein CheW [Geomonas sp.]HJV35006.1 chemotaxis protein CheW [Geomonas sp.]